MMRAVLFDVDGVLIDSLEANFQFLRDLLTRFGYTFPTKEQYVKDLFHLPMRDVIRQVSKSTNEGEITRIWEVGRSREVPYRTELVTTPPGAKEAIEELAKRYMLGIVTNRIQEGVYEVPALAALRQFFKTTITYQDVVNHKPHPEPLLLAARNLGITPGEAVYVGDRDTDMQAAAAAGMKFIAYTNPDLSADAHVSSFGEIARFVASFSS